MTHTLPQNLTNSKPLEPRRVVLLQAADYIRDHGWCQDSLSRGEAVCAVGAIYAVCEILRDPACFGFPSSPEASDGYDLSTKAVRLLGEHLEPSGVLDNAPSGRPRIPFWNDAPNRTEEEVIAGLTSAAFHNLDVTP